MWFQLWDAELTNTTDFVLGSKVAELPSTVHIKLPGLDGIEEQAAKEKEENEASSEALKAREGDVDAAARAATRKFRLTATSHAPSRAHSPPSSSLKGSFTAEIGTAAALDDGEERLDGGGDGEGHEDKGKATTTKSHGHHKRNPAVPSSSSAAQSTLPRKTVVVEECGGLQAVPVSDKSRQIGAPPADSGLHTRRDGSALVSTTKRMTYLFCPFTSLLFFGSNRLSHPSFHPHCALFSLLIGLQDTSRTQEQATAAATNLRFHTKSSFYLVITRHT